MSSHINLDLAASKLIARPQGATIEELCSELHISRRSVFRLFRRLEDQGYMLYDDSSPRKGREKVYRLNVTNSRTWSIPLPQLLFSEEEKTLLEFLLRQAGDTPVLHEQIQKIIIKLNALAAEGGAAFPALDTNQGKHRNRPVPLLHVADIPKLSTEMEAAVLQLLLEAITHNEACTITYYAASSDTTKTYDIQPLVSFFHDGGVYVYAMPVQSEHLITLAVERILEISKSKVSVDTSRHTIDVEELLQDPFGITLDHELFTAKLHIDPWQGWYVRQRDWPESVLIEQRADHSIYFTVTTRGLWELRKWILSQGDSVTVLEPDWLKEDIVSNLQSALETYQS